MMYANYQRVTNTVLLPLLSLLLALLLNMAFAPSSSALQVTGLYSFQIAVSNESEAERVRAFREALAAVIVKVTGSQRWLEDGNVARALTNAQSYVEAISYSSELMPVPDALAVEQRFVNVTFAASLINELLISAGVPIWDSNRPSVLLWMVLQEVNGERRLLTADGDPEMVALIQRFGTERGVPVIFPVLDFEDRRSLPLESLWNLDQAVITAASARYGADSVLSGRLLFTASGELVGLWQFIFQNQATVFDGFESDLKVYLYNPLERITTQLADYFAVVPVTTDQNYVLLRVEGIDDLQAYSSLLNYVGTLGLVRSMVVATLDGTRLELELGLQGDSQQLLELITLDRDLTPIASSQGRDPSVLHYRWAR